MNRTFSLTDPSKEFRFQRLSCQNCPSESCAWKGQSTLVLNSIVLYWCPYTSRVFTALEAAHLFTGSLYYPDEEDWLILYDEEYGIIAQNDGTITGYNKTKLNDTFSWLNK